MDYILGTLVDAYFLFRRQEDQGQIGVVLHVPSVPHLFGNLVFVGNGIRIQLVIKAVSKSKD